ncbi:HET-domain-containing protein [Stipitochalara longipes BDJ]|nr:HET-domain-containing protein [Stipitochalara longipes BDJ]
MTTESDSAPDPSWAYFSAENDVLITMSQHCPERPYVSLQFGTPGVSSQKLSVRRIIWTTISHDQGYSGAPHCYGTYDQSNTWFDGRIVMPSGHDRVSRRRIQINVHASLEFKTHVNRWDSGDGTDELRAWLAAIQVGDTIQIAPMAHYPGWTNFVRGAKIQLWATPVVEAPGFAISLIEKNDYSAHRPLREDLKEIRLVEIQPDILEQPIRLKLQYTKLGDDRLRYEALSYCWGDMEEVHPVLLTDADSSLSREMFLNKNLFSALRQFRSSTTARMLWIDLLCINQTDVQERTLQVALMGDIFASADSVCVWLGESDANVHQDCQVIQSISDQYEQALDGIGEDKHVEESKHGTELPEAHLTHKIIRTGPEGWAYKRDNDRIVQRPWFQRVWVLQEVWNAAHVRIFCGSDEVRWEAILQANKCWKKHGILSRNVLSWLWTALFTVKRDETELSCSRAPRFDILTVLIAAHSMQATDPRDKIFAMLVFGDETHQIGNLPDEVRPNYEKNVVQVYADFTRWWILHHNSLRILSAVHTLTSRSWANMFDPHGQESSFDLSQRPSWMFWHEGFSEWMHGTLALHDQCNYKASGNHGIDRDLLASMALTQPASIALRGVRVSTINSLSPYPFLRQPYSEAMQEAFMRVFDPSGTIGTWNSFNIRRSVGESIDMADHSNKPSEWGAHYNSHWSDSSWNPSWLPCFENCMFTTRDGGVGLCPSGSRVGDLVVVLFGGMVPYLLRPKILGRTEVDRERAGSQEFYFVGECYFEGLMDGEACSSISDSDTELSISTMPPVATSYFPAPNDWAIMYNNYSGSGLVLSAINPTGGLLQMTSTVSPSAYWQIFPLNNIYYIRNKATGASLQLDAIFSAQDQAYMPSLQSADSSASGQQWNFISDVVNDVQFWNVESGGASGVQLDTYSNTLQPFFEAAGHSGQMWSFSSVGKINDVAFSTIAGVSATTAVTNAAVPTATSTGGSGVSIVQPPQAPSTSSSASPGATSTSSSTAGGALQSLSSSSGSHSLSTGAIAGIAVGAAIIGVLLAIGIGFFLWRRKTRSSQQNANPTPAAQHSNPAEMGGDHREYYGPVDKKATEGSHAVEIGGAPVQRAVPPTELPAGG